MKVYEDAFGNTHFHLTAEERREIQRWDRLSSKERSNKRNRKCQRMTRIAFHPRGVGHKARLVTA